MKDLLVFFSGNGHVFWWCLAYFMACTLVALIIAEIFELKGK